MENIEISGPIFFIRFLHNLVTLDFYFKLFNMIYNANKIYRYVTIVILLSCYFLFFFCLLFLLFLLFDTFAGCFTISSDLFGL